MQKERNIHPGPVVRLHASSESESDNERNDDKADDPVAYEESDENQKEKKLLEALSGIAAKAKEKIKTMAMTDSVQNLNSSKVEAKIPPDAPHTDSRAASKRDGAKQQTLSPTKSRSRTPSVAGSEDEDKDRKEKPDSR